MLFLRYYHTGWAKVLWWINFRNSLEYSIVKNVRNWLGKRNTYNLSKGNSMIVLFCGRKNHSMICLVCTWDANIFLEKKSIGSVSVLCK